MKITGIDKARSKKGQLILLTDPPLTPSVFGKFQEVWRVAAFTIEGNSLVWTGATDALDKEFPSTTAIYLTEAENAIKAEKSLDTYFQDVSERTGLPLI
jgi:hypothetical protein